MTYKDLTGAELFTPLNERREIRGRFNADKVEVIEDNGLDQRKRGLKGIVKIQGTLYKVYGISCGLPHCMCDSYLKEIKED